MKYNERTLEQYKKEYYKRFPKNKLQILSFVNNTKVLVNSEFGVCVFPKTTLLKGANPSVKSAINKTEYFINQIKQFYGSKYDYSLVNYINYNTKIELICNLHGKFYQRTDHLLSNTGCPKCGRILSCNHMKENPTGWSYKHWIKSAAKSKNFDSFKVYIIKCWNKDEEFYKIGRTFTSVRKRFDWKHLMPYKYKIIKIFVGEGKEIVELEQKLKSINKMNKYKPKIHFAGSCECFSKLLKDEIIFTS